MRLQKFLRDNGFGSRRACDQLVGNRKVSVNGNVVDSPTCYLRDGDRITAE
ncbi:MAG: hypothetical protein GF311_27840, partial [Candidatus Lokiarchaeota archaeon]|nr:hypothetical protein [Candidatus Lokiarchaeota archaeon]